MTARSAPGATIALGSIDTGNADRDAHVRQADLMDVERRPAHDVRVERGVGEGRRLVPGGRVAIGDMTRPVALAVEFGGAADVPPDGSRHAGFEATGEIRRSDFGLGFGAGLLGDVVKLQLDMQFVEPQGQGG
ncbi:YceI family protein [Streptomyces sp. NPDC056696]|uniref:YceI family protein n=1 Tax=Streptomyces sp. NPDC056696 TaxID=3345914 RepID=UPI00369A6ED0